ncbi:MAG: 50S ribosomal protein L2 [Nanoarchaeota archaeon]
MGKRIIQQARGKGSLSYRAKKSAFNYRISYPANSGEAEIINLIHSAGHTAPLAKLKINSEIFFIPAFNHAFIGQKILVGKEPKEGNITFLKNILPGTQIFNIENNPGDGGKIMRSAGTSAILLKTQGNNSTILLPNKREIIVNENCRATIGRVAGTGRILKPFIGAGGKFYKMKSRNKLWPRTSAVKFNAVDHPFGSGRGKRIKSKIAKRNAPPGSKVGHIRPRRTGRRR